MLNHSCIKGCFHMALNFIIRLAWLGLIELFCADEQRRHIIISVSLDYVRPLRFFIPMDWHLAVRRIFTD